MNRFKIEGIFVLVLALVTALLFFYVPMNKLQYVGGATNYIYSVVLYLIIGSLLAFNYYVLGYAFWLNLIMVLVLSILSRFISVTIVRLVIYKLEQADQFATTFGWQFQVKWLELFVVGVVMVLLTEIWIVVTRKFSS